MTGSQIPVIMSWVILVMIVLVTSLISLTWKTRIMMVTFHRLKQGTFDSLGLKNLLHYSTLQVLE